MNRDSLTDAFHAFQKIVCIKQGGWPLPGNGKPEIVEIRIHSFIVDNLI